ncbi:MAG TPA: DNA polymerase III subunit gamma/tau, partial [Planctomycetaceae bacterium]|nr:DNA polymerase III subunit gamma/tau [Planctomycetaceae bacterium]
MGAHMAKSTPEYTVVARRYRPRQFADLIGQEPVAQALRNALTSDRVAHAYLFTGARGVGKTSAARILAKALNCEKGPTVTPCDQCTSCVAIATGDDIDVREIDGASNRQIEDIRNIRQDVSTRPTRGRYKIYIIDEVHMLTTFAFNALLKTLEEPPPHVKFIFATTDVQKVPITILSRCQRFDFGTIRTERIAKQLRAIVEAEKMQADDDSLEIIARRANGSMRDAQSLLD